MLTQVNRSVTSGLSGLRGLLRPAGTARWQERV